MNIMMKHNTNSKKRTKYDQKNTRDRNRMSAFEGYPIVVVAKLVAYGKTTITETIPRSTVLLCNLTTQFNDEICQHVWVRLDEIKNFHEVSDQIKQGATLTILATPYRYYNDMGRKVRNIKYSLGNIKILKVA